MEEETLTKALGDVIDLVDIRVTRKYRVSRQHLSVETADGPDVDLLAVVRVPDQELGGPVPSGGHVVRVDLPLGGHDPREPEVAEFDQTELGDENVLWLDISVNDLQRRNILILIR